MADPKSYGVTVRFRDFEGEECYEARVRELPDIAEYADSLEEAYKLALDSIATTVEILQEKGRAVPEPEDVSDEFSGRITLRIPKTLHKSLAQRAQEEGVSLNSMLTTVLSAFHGFDSALN